MTGSSLDDEAIWGVPGAIIDPPIPGAEAFGSTPLIDHLRATVARDPDAVALVGQAGSLRYGELLRLALNVAASLAARVPLGHPVACHMSRSPIGVVGLLGCLISGRLCLILDPANPPERQAILLADAAPALVLVEDSLPCATPAPVLTLREAMANAHHDWTPIPAPDPDAPMVVHFTSGSSGRPKGIVLSARSVLYRTSCYASRWALAETDRIFALSIPIAGSGIPLLLAALTHGARAVLCDLAKENVGAVLRLVEQQAVTYVAMLAPIARVLLRHPGADAAFRRTRSLRVGGGALAPADIEALRARLPPDCVIWHAYASTEALVVAAWVVPPNHVDNEATIAAGRLQHCHDYALLDEDDRAVEAGAAGELVLRSRYVSLGEWRGGRLVTDRMPPVPGRPGWRTFRTGDRLRVRPDGMMHVLGRADRQVKINAVRVEPGEIEAVLRGAPGVADAAVVANTTAGRVTLHGFVVATTDDPGAFIAALRKQLAMVLPSALNPTGITLLDRLPMLPGGKVDLVALSERSRDQATVQPPLSGRL